jgi:PAS domain S-box-containing protein
MVDGIMYWQLPVLIAISTGSAILAFVYIFLYLQDRKLYIGIWAAAWAVFTLRFIFLIGVLGAPDVLLLNAGHYLCLITSNLLLLWGMMVFLNKPFSRWWVYGAVLTSIWTFAASVLGGTSFVVSLPGSLLLSAASIWAGSALLRAQGGNAIEWRVTAWTFILWGVHELDYPFLCDVESFTAWGYFIGAALQFLTAIGILLVYYRRILSELGASEQKYRALFEQMNDAAFLLDFEGTFIEVNQQGARMLGYARDEIAGMSFKQVVSPSEQPDDMCMLKALRDGQEMPAYERILCKKNGEQISVEVNSKLLYSADGSPLYIQSVARDITERKQAELTLAQERSLLQTLIDTLPDYIFVKDTQGRYLMVNEQGVWGRDAKSREDVIGKTDFDFISSERARDYQLQEQAILESGEPVFNLEETLVLLSGKELCFLTTKVPFRDSEGRVAGLVGISRDITERKQAEKALMASLGEKEVLLREVHHRVKNNLQVISSLLDLQADYVQDPRHALQDSRSRVRSMAMVHEQLYQSSTLDRINADAYVENLISSLADIYYDRARDIVFDRRVDEIALSIDMAVLCGLIINELVSNALVHAFPAQQGGRIEVELCAQDDDLCMLMVRDDGVGLPPDLNRCEASSLGLKLVNILTRQLNGSLEVKQEGGAAFYITFACIEPAG